MYGAIDYGAADTSRSLNVASKVKRLRAIEAKLAKLDQEKASLTAAAVGAAKRTKTGTTLVARRANYQLYRRVQTKLNFVNMQIRTLKTAAGSIRNQLKAANVASAATPTRLTAPGLPPQQSSGLTPEQLAEIKEMISELQARGASEEQAEEQAKARVLPPHLVRAYPPGYFRGVRRAGPRPVPYTTPVYRPTPGEFAPGWSIDPMPRGRGIDPRAVGRGIDPIVGARPIDPAVPGVTLPTVGGAFTFPPGNIADAAKMTVDAAKAEETKGAEDAEALDGVTEGTGEIPWVWIAGGAAALFLLPKLMGGKGKKGGSAEAKENPRRRRHRKNRRSHRRSRR